MLNTSPIPAVVDPVSREIFFEQPNGSLVELDGSVWTVEFKMPKNFSQRDSESKPFGPDDYTVEVNYTQKEPMLLTDSDESYTTEIGASDFSEVEGDDMGYVHFKWTPPSQAALSDGWLWFSIRVYDGDGHTWSTKAKKIRVWPAIQGTLMPTPGDSTDTRRFAILYTEQNLTESQKSIARTNIGLGDILTKSGLYRGSIASGALSDRLSNGWYLIATNNRPNITDCPDGANNICYLVNHSTGSGAYQTFYTIFGQSWWRRVTGDGTVGMWHEMGYSSSSDAAREKFVEMMNRKANHLGMQDTLYDNPSCRIFTPPNKNYTSVMDMLRLAVAAYQSPAFRRYSGLEIATIYTGNEDAPYIEAVNLLADPERTVSDTPIGSLFQRLKDLGFTVIGGKSGSRSFDNTSIVNLICVAQNDANGDIYAISILGSTSTIHLFSAAEECFKLERILATGKVVPSLPATGESGITYLVKTSSAPDVYDEYIYSGNSFTKIGSTGNPPMPNTQVVSMAGCHIVADSPYFGDSFRNVDHGFLYENGIVKDFKTGKAADESTRNPVIQVSASIVKVMMLLVAEETIGNWNDRYYVTSYDSSIGGSGHALETGYLMTLEDLAIYSMLRSSNEAICCLATYSGGKMLYSNYVGV